MHNDNHIIFESYLNEAKKLAKKDYDKDGKLETSEQEYKGVKDAAIKRAKGMPPEEDCECTSKVTPSMSPISNRTPQYRAARAGKNIGKKGKGTGFANIVKRANKKYRSKAAGRRVAGAVLAEMRQNEETVTEYANVGMQGSGNADNSMMYEELKAIIVKARQLAAGIKGQLNIEPWCHAKVTLAANYIESVHDHLMFGHSRLQPRVNFDATNDAEDCERIGG